MPHSGSRSRTLANDSFAGSNQKEWNKDMARLKSFCAAALQETGKLTSPSLSGGVPRGAPCSLCCAHALDVAKPRTITSTDVKSFVIFMISSMIIRTTTHGRDRVKLRESPPTAVGGCFQVQPTREGATDDVIIIFFLASRGKIITG